MCYVSNVLYPQRDGATFKMKYYLDTHMPLVAKHWKPAGLQKWEVVEMNLAPQGAKPAFNVAAILTWKDQASCEAALALEGTQEIFGDIPKFSTEQPIFVGGTIVSRG
ncbi:hypothetical protein MRS44_013160 [Fusarium solani]|uniref:uncharacterized protein n=1 Tax=Fusarium solani TaxID=169388 RepID=UPI0032C40C9D|nr:hypothetical protein MRS44_013160 [Fusarium solani]